MTDLKDYKEIKDVNFDFDGAHIAVVHKKQGGAANGFHSALITKSTKDISERDLDELIEKDFGRAKVSMRLDDFLSYFKGLPEEEQEEAFYHYEQRAEGIVPVLNETFFEDRVADMDFMKSISLEDLDKLTDEEKLKIKLFQSEFEKDLLSGESKIKGDLNKRSNSKYRTTGDKENMSEKENKKEDLEKAVLESEFVKAMKKELDLLKAEKEKAEHKALVKSLCGFSFLEEEDAESLAKGLKTLNSEAQDSILDVLSKANKKIEDAEMYVQKSVSGEGEDYTPSEDLANKVSKALKGE